MIASRSPQPFIFAGAFLALAVAFGSPEAQAQNKAAQQPFHVTTRVVNVSVVVTDKKGNLVKDLRQEDFSLFDRGQPQRIAFFSAVDNQQPIPAAPAPANDVYTNLVAAKGAAPSVTVILFDVVNTFWTAQAYALHRFRKFLRQIQPQDRFGLYLLGDNFEVLHDFTRDSTDLIAAMQRYDATHGRGARRLPRGPMKSDAELALDRFLSGKDLHFRYFLLPSAFGSPPYVLAKFDWATQVTVQAIDSIARELAAVPGRKSLVWMTDLSTGGNYFLNDGSFSDWTMWHGRMEFQIPGHWWGNVDEIERMIRHLNDSGVAVYPVSAAGLGMTDTFDWFLLELAEHTGGRAFYNRNDLETGIQRTLQDSQFSYSLAYYPDHHKWKGEWRKIKVKVNRPGVRVLARQGYYALPDPPLATVTPKGRNQLLSDVAQSPVDSARLPLTVRLALSSPSREPEVSVTVHYDLRPLLTQQENGHWTGNFETVFMQFDRTDNLLDVQAKAVEADVKPELYPEAAEKGWNLTVPLKLIRSAKVLCVILHDFKTDEVGSVRIPVAKYFAQ